MPVESHHSVYVVSPILYEVIIIFCYLLLLRIICPFIRGLGFVCYVLVIVYVCFPFLLLFYSCFSRLISFRSLSSFSSCSLFFICFLATFFCGGFVLSSFVCFGFVCCSSPHLFSFCFLVALSPFYLLFSRLFNFPTSSSFFFPFLFNILLLRMFFVLCFSTLGFVCSLSFSSSLTSLSSRACVFPYV